MKSLNEIYRAHQNKASAKWELYIEEYERLFYPYRDSELRMLEIGVQNGGSLEIWGQYFAKAKAFVGCDIDLKCSELVYEDKRISIVVGDANSDNTQTEILAASNNFDLIIDDGSHQSADIIQSFVRYFAYLNENGIFIIEDLHCSYWQEFKGGLYHPFSSIAFFKCLVDVINQEHWLNDKNSMQLLSGFAKEYSICFFEELLSQIHSIEFINSICVIRKRKAQHNHLGMQIFSGIEEHVTPARDFPPPHQKSNQWSMLDSSPSESYEKLVQEIVKKNALLLEKENQLTQKKSQLASIKNSWSWRLTKFMRLFS